MMLTTLYEYLLMQPLMVFNRGDGGYIVVDGVGINPGDLFLFYHSDSENASAACDLVFDNLGTLKADSNRRTSRLVKGVANKREVFGGFIFSCYFRGESFFSHPNVDSAPFVLNFPRVPLAGVFCSGEIGRGSMRLNGLEEDDEEEEEEEDEEEDDLPRCCLHFYGTVYLVMSYTPVPPHH